MNSFILVIWTVVSIGGTQFTVHEKRGWQVIGNFQTEQACAAAAAALGSTTFRCLPTK